MKAIIDIDKALHNIRIIRSHTDAQVYAVVKANAYGHGMEFAEFIQPHADGFCVATEEEAQGLVNSGIHKQILILGVCTERNLLSEAKNIVYTVCSVEDIKRLETSNGRAKFFIKVNTGMNRLGCEPDDLSEIISYVRHKNLKCEGLYTHFFNTDPKCVTDQYNDFKNAIIGHDLASLKNHCCASNMFSVGREFHGDIVRVGLGLYGYTIDDYELKPIMRVCAPIIAIRALHKGDYVGYGSFRLERDSKVAVIRAGYGDGYRRIKQNKVRYVAFNGVLCPIMGQVCMDMCMIDVSNVDAKVGDYVYLLGNGITAQMLADEYETSVYEVLTSFGARVERIYINGQKEFTNSNA